MQLNDAIDASAWKSVPDKVGYLAKLAAGTYQSLSDIRSCFSDNYQLWYNPESKTAAICHLKDADAEKLAAAKDIVADIPGVETVTTSTNEPPRAETYLFVKGAEVLASDILGPVASTMQLKPNWLNRLWGGPNPLSSLIASSLLGAGLGYGGGWLAEKVLPEEHFRRGRLRRTGALFGGLAGAAIPALWTWSRFAHGPKDWSAWEKLTQPAEYAKQGRAALENALPKEIIELDEQWIKYAQGDTGLMFDKKVPVDQFNRVIWNDLRTTGGYTPPPVAAATTGLVQAASLSQGGTNLVSPWDIARIGMGAGSGYLSGLLVGKTLGALAGLQPPTQKKLQDVGIWAGILSNIVPMAFR